MSARTSDAKGGGAMPGDEPASAAVTLRPLALHDDLGALTARLHRAYARLGAMGLNFTAVDQEVEVTRQRFASGQGFVLDDGGTLVGCVVVAGPFDPVHHPGVLRSPWYLRRDVAHLHQLAVDPARQGERLGDRLVAACEAWARQRGFRAIALDTAEPAQHLRALCAPGLRRGRPRAVGGQALPQPDPGQAAGRRDADGRRSGPPRRAGVGGVRRRWTTST
jgi:GNAT superfamily N-acetyltransferase